MSAIAPFPFERLPPASATAWDDLGSDWQQRIRPALGTAQPSHFIAPPTEAALSATLALAHENRWPLLLCGQGSKLSWGNPLQAAVSPLVISTLQLNRLVEHAAADLTITVEAGMTLAQLQRHLAQHNQFLPLDPSFPAQASLGGIIATADAGSLRHRYGGVRDLLLGIRFVRADGQVAKAGGRVVKNVAGYDLMKLFTGSYGSLGLMTQATFKTFPLPETYQTVVLTGELDLLTPAARHLARSTLSPIAFDWFSAPLSRRLALPEGPALALRFGSVAASTAEQGDEVCRLGQQLGLTVTRLAEQPERGVWQNLATVLDGATVGCKLGLLPSQIPATLARLQAQDPEHLCRIHNGSGLGQLCASAEVWEPAQLLALRQHCDRHGGFLSLLTAPPALKQQLDIWGYSGNALEAMGRIRASFDPHAVLNPGRFLV